MNSSAKRALAVLLVGPLTWSCDDVGAEALERFEAERQRVEGELQQRLDQASAELEQLKADSEVQLEQLQRELEIQRAGARARLAELRAAGEEAWHDALEDVRREVDEYGERAQEALSGD